MIDPDKIYQKIYDAGQDWADKNAAAHMFEEMQKTVLAECMIAQKSLFPDLPQNQIEVKARASNEYRNHIDKLVTARKEANKARVKYDSAKIWFEAARSVESTNRAEMGLR